MASRFAPYFNVLSKHILLPTHSEQSIDSLGKRIPLIRDQT